MKNIQTYILIGFFCVFLWWMTKMNKTMNLQTSLLLGMASKLGFKPMGDDDDIVIPDRKQVPKTSQERPETAEEKEMREENELVAYMIAISDEIKIKGKLSAQEQQVYVQNFPDMHEDLQLANPSEIILQEDNGSTDNNGGDNNGNDNNGEAGPARMKLTSEEKQTVMLTFFLDEIPKQLQPLIASFATKTGLKPNKGNTHSLLKDMVGNKKLMTYTNKSGNVFYVLPEWMDKKKLKPEYLKNIA